MQKRTNTAVWLENQNRWQINVQKDGVRRSFTSSKRGRTGQREANAKADAWLDDGLNLPRSRKVSDIYPMFLEDVQARTCKGNWTVLHSRMEHWVLPIIGNVKVEDLTDFHAQNVINNAYRKGGISKKGLLNIRGDLSAFAKFCRKAKLTTYRPEDIDIPAQAAAPEKPILQPDDLKILFSEDTVLYHGVQRVDAYIYAYRLQVLTGMRPGELLGLRKSDRNGSTVNIQRSLNRWGEITTGKNSNARRSVVLTPIAAECWDKQAALYPETDELFPLSTQELYRSHLERYCKQHGMTVVSPYCLRHTFVSAVKSLPEGMVKDIVGHSKSMDTFGVYSHAFDGDNNTVQQAISERFNQILNR